MARVWMPGGGGGADLDVVNATALDVVAPKVIVDKNGDPLTGELVERQSYVNALSSVWNNTDGLLNRIPVGAYRTATTSGYPEIKAAPNDVRNAGGLSADKLMVGKSAFGLNGTATSDANAVAGNILSGNTAYVNGAKLAGSMPNYRATPTPIDAIRINNNRFEVAVAAGCHGYSWANNGYEYMSFSQVANAIGLTSAKLKKNELVCGVTGTFEGWVPTANDLYVRGNNIAGFTHSIYGKVNYEVGGMQVLSDSNNRGACLHELSAGNIDYTKYNYLNIEGYYERRGIILPSERNLKFNIRIRDSASGMATLAEANNAMPANYSNFTTSLYIGTLALSRRSYIDLGVSGEYYYSGDDGNYWDPFTMSGWLGWVYRIWLS